MILCICQGVSDRVVRLAVLGGATTVDAVADRCGAGTDCGSCRHAIQDLVEEVTGGVPADYSEIGWIPIEARIVRSTA
jgi:bacterioferritin-associated ferredoxin